MIITELDWDCAQPVKSEGLSQIKVSIDEALDKMDKLNSNKSPGPDGLHPKVLKKYKYETAELLAVICTLLLKSASGPDDWRVANIMLIF